MRTLSIEGKELPTVVCCDASDQDSRPIGNYDRKTGDMCWTGVNVQCKSCKARFMLLPNKVIWLKETIA